MESNQLNNPEDNGQDKDTITKNTKSDLEVNNLSINPEDIKTEVSTLLKNTDISQINSFLVGKTMNQWIEEASKQSIPKMLLSEFWHETDVCILFSSTGLGKSIFAFQIGDSISKGIPIPGFKMEAEKQKVLYFDFELSSKQLEKRFSNNFKDHYKFDDNFIRVRPDIKNYKASANQNYETYLNTEIEGYIIKTGIKIVILDNLTYIKTDVEKAKDANSFMKKLNDLAEKYSLSILVLAHTPKRSALNPLTVNDLSGSSALAQFCDAMIAIGICAKDTRTRYIKQIKERWTEKLYGEDNVIICSVDQPDNFLRFSFLSYGRESDLIRPDSEDEKDFFDNEVKRMFNIENYSLQKIADELRTNKAKIQRVVDRLFPKDKNGERENLTKLF